MKKPLIRILILLLALSLCALCPGCKAQEAEVVIDLSAESTGDAEPEAAQAQAPIAGDAAVAVQDAVAYCFSGAEGATLYGAVSYENTGDCPAVLTGAAFTFSFGGKTVEHSFVPAFADQVVVQPGEISYAALWYKCPEATAGEDVALSAALTCVPAATDRLLLSVSDVFLADNYPGFTTMTGSIAAPGACGLNLIYTAFYNADGKLLGVWHFTKNASLDAGDKKTFVVHMKELPVSALAEKTAEVRAFAVGF